MSLELLERGLKDLLNDMGEHNINLEFVSCPNDRSNLSIMLSTDHRLKVELVNRIAILFNAKTTQVVLDNYDCHIEFIIEPVEEEKEENK